MKREESKPVTQKKAFEKAWINNFGYLLLGIKALTLLICMSIFYPFLADDIASFFEEKQTVSISSKDKMAVYVDPDDRVENGIHVATGMIHADGFEVVRATCTACHSAKLVTQNRATRAGWAQMIDWMQATQGLWELGDKEPIILDYLAKHYAPQAIGRRAQIDVEAIEWYLLEEENE